MLPAAVVIIAVVGYVVSSFQTEVGLMEPGKGPRVAVAAAAEALGAATGPVADGYSAFSRTLLAATVAQRNAAVGNPADARVQALLTEALDCLYAVREAWQADIDGAWDPQTQGSASYWNTVHPALELAGESLLTAEDVRRMGAERAADRLEQALGLVD